MSPLANSHFKGPNLLPSLWEKISHVTSDQMTPVYCLRAQTMTHETPSATKFSAPEISNEKNEFTWLSVSVSSK
jgi:hypothetical protein